MSPLEKELETAMLNLYESWKAFGPSRNFFLQMVKKARNTARYKGPAGTVRYLMRGEAATGFIDLVRTGHAELTVESLI